MVGLLKGKFIAINANEFQGKTYYKAIFLVESDKGHKDIEYVSVDADHMPEISVLEFGQDVELHCRWSQSKEGNGKWRY